MAVILNECSLVCYVRQLCLRRRVCAPADDAGGEAAVVSAFSQLFLSASASAALAGHRRAAVIIRPWRGQDDGYLYLCASALFVAIYRLHSSSLFGVARLTPSLILR